MVKHVTLHRLTVQNELMDLFQDSNILNYELKMQLIDPRGEVEMGLGDGVTREVFCLFFKEFMPGNMIGFQEKVPSLRHDMTQCLWISIARILLYSLRNDYFPLSLSPTFLVSTLFGDENVNPSMLLDSFQNYVSMDEKETIKETLSHFDESEELLDLLSSYRCFRKPTKDNIKNILVEIAHQEIIQKPRYVSNCFSQEFKRYKLPSQLQSVSNLFEFYTQRKPTSKKVIKALTFDVANDQERIVQGHLCRYLKCLDLTELKKFLHYTTGGDIMPAHGINVIFVANQLPRAPVSRICVPQLEISDSYSSYNELAQEFNHILNNKDSFLLSFV